MAALEMTTWLVAAKAEVVFRCNIPPCLAVCLPRWAGVTAISAIVILSTGRMKNDHFLRCVPHSMHSDLLELLEESDVEDGEERLSTYWSMPIFSSFSAGISHPGIFGGSFLSTGQ